MRAMARHTGLAAAIWYAAVFILGALLPANSPANEAEDFNAAVERWHALKISNYSFVYEEGGAVLIAPYCAGTKIRVRVRHGASSSPVVVAGHAHCPTGTRGARIDVTVPATIDDAFEAIRRYVFNPPTPVELTVTYDSKYGVPLSYYAAKTEISDSDEGFKISKFEVTRNLRSPVKGAK
jgi:Family of unknown function (DUF6174)